MSLKQGLFGLIAVALIGVPPAYGVDPPREVQVDATATREAKVEGVRVVLLSAGYETVFTGDADPKKAVARRLSIVYLVEPYNRKKEWYVMVEPVRAFAAGTDTAVKAASGEWSTTTSVKEYRRRYFRTSRSTLPDVENARRATVVEQTISLLETEPEPDRVDLLIDAQNGEGQGGPFRFKGVRLK